MGRSLPYGALLAGSLLTACTPAPTQLVVVVDTDIAIPGEIDEVIVQVTGPGGAMERESSMLEDRGVLPLTLGVAPSGDALGPIEVVAIGRLGGELVVTRTHRVELVRGESRMLVMHLARTCVDTRCGTGRTCAEQGCVPVDVSPEALAAWTGTPSRIDEDGGGVGDGGVDGGRVPCGTPVECDDSNPCTDDVCTPDGCTNTMNDAACDDGLFCNGLDRCVRGTCTGSGDPCSATTTCDEAAGVCEGCSTDADCPAPTEGAWGSCAFDDGACGESGTTSRTVVAFRCESGSCVPRETTETQPCARETDGDVCASTSCAGFGECVASGPGCDAAGMRTRTCSRGVCSAGACTTETMPDTEACSRSTDGDECAPETCEAWGACAFPSTCATSGTQSRTCTGAATCSGGSCGSGATRTETQPCTQESTDRTPCGPGTCGAWGTCTGDIGTCDTAGTQTRTCTPDVCTGGLCGAGAAVAETRSCTRDVTGLSCDDGDRCTNLDRCTSTGFCTGRFCAHCCEIEPL